MVRAAPRALSGAARAEGRIGVRWAHVSVLASANEVMLKVVDLVMYDAPIGLGAYFAHLVGSFDAR